ncbi:response regulator [candidate division WWE3 bacterium]|uniref:Response regulator n=1 Tax=candidate division WWE3 bacterium TaxID=2053526 RepID=A0A955LL38_UNCKA|nr:response regulator [candidate division WWE3 bacterium]
MAKTVLLIEDEIYLNDLYKMTLEADGYTVLAAYDGEQGVEQANNHPDIIYLDIMLPKINGIDVLKKLKENDATKDIPVVILSNLGQESIVQQALTLGAKEYVIKLQIEPADLATKTKDLIGK